MNNTITRQGQMQKEVVVKNKNGLSRLFTSPLAVFRALCLFRLRPWREKVTARPDEGVYKELPLWRGCRAGEGYKNQVILDRGFFRLAASRKVVIRDLTTVTKAVRFQDPVLRHYGVGPKVMPRFGMTSLFNKGFTLIELLVAIMIIGILAAVAVPQYQKAVMKSRFAAMMPIAKTLANANEVYYAEHDEYSTDPAKLNVTPQAGTPDGTAINMYSNPEEVSFVRVENPGVPNARYVVYQKLSENFPETTWCEAGDTRTEELCVALGGTLPEGLTGNSSGDNTNYKAYLLTGLARSGDKFAEPVCLGAVCDENGNITECNSGETLNNGECIACDIPNATECSTTAYAATSCGTGYTLNNGSCEACSTAFPNATACSATSYAPTACSEGYVLNGNACEIDPTYAKLQTVANTQCPEGDTRYICTIKNGAVYRCDTNSGKIDSQTGECVSNGTIAGAYENIYDADGELIETYSCSSFDSGHCVSASNKISTADGYREMTRSCADNGAITKEGVCANGYEAGIDYSYNSHGDSTSAFMCSTSGISTTTGECGTYREMTTYDNRYTAGKRSFVTKRCTTATDSNPESTCSGSYQPVYSQQYNEAGTAYKEVRCYNSSNKGRALNADGTCPSGYPNVKSYDSSTKKYTTCGTTAASANWETATCK